MSEKLKALIVDDERLARKELRSLLDEHPAIEIVGEAESVARAINLLESAKPDVVFLDIQLAGETGFDLLETTAATNFKTIFVTAFDAYAIRAFEVNALDYLLKPVNPERLKKAIEKILDAESKPAPSASRPLELNDRVFLETGSRPVFLPISSISHILAAGDYSEIFTAAGEKLLVEKSLREWEARLPENHFARIHRSAIVNLNRVGRIESWFNRSYRIHLQNVDAPFVVSRRYAAKLKLKFA